MLELKEATSKFKLRASDFVAQTYATLEGEEQTKGVKSKYGRLAHDWKAEEKAERAVFDDGTMTYFWRGHTMTVLFTLIIGLIYVATVEPVETDSFYNTKRGLIAVIIVFVLVGVTVTPDGPFRRPHPAIWRFAFCCSIVYELALIFLLFQTSTDARLLLKHVDPQLGEPLAEKDYGGNCRIYDPDRPDDPFHNVWDKMDVFVPSHMFGWLMKTLILRDWWVCMVISVMFEILEYTLEHQLPNFSECWWDHWILDALVCNGLGILLGLMVLNYFSLKTYFWRGLWKIRTYRGKLSRIIGQFGPYSWIDFEWKPTSSLGRWMSMLGIIFMFLVTELNTFYLKFVLWVPPEHWLNAARLFFMLLWGAVALRETFQYLDDPECDEFGRQSWLVAAIVSSEFLIVVKFGWETVSKPLPRSVAIFWLLGVGLLILWTVWNFFLKVHPSEKRNSNWNHVGKADSQKSAREKPSALRSPGEARRTQSLRLRHHRNTKMNSHRNA